MVTRFRSLEPGRAVTFVGGRAHSLRPSHIDPRAASPFLDQVELARLDGLGHPRRGSGFDAWLLGDLWTAPWLPWVLLKPGGRGPTRRVGGTFFTFFLIKISWSRGGLVVRTHPTTNTPLPPFTPGRRPRPSRRRPARWAPGRRPRPPRASPRARSAALVPSS